MFYHQIKIHWIQVNTGIVLIIIIIRINCIYYIYNNGETDTYKAKVSLKNFFMVVLTEDCVAAIVWYDVYNVNRGISDVYIICVNPKSIDKKIEFEMNGRACYQHLTSLL